MNFTSQRSNSHVTPQNKICKIKGIAKKLSTKSNVNLFMEQPPYSKLTSILRCKGTSIMGFHKSQSLYITFDIIGCFHLI